MEKSKKKRTDKEKKSNLRSKKKIERILYQGRDKKYPIRERKKHDNVIVTSYIYNKYNKGMERHYDVIRRKYNDKNC